MIPYLIEFTLLHTLFFIVYKLLLARETQLSFLRFFLLGSTALSLVLPLIKIPNPTPLPTISAETILLPVVSTTAVDSAPTTPWYFYLFATTSTLLAIHFLIDLFRIFRYYLKSEARVISHIKVRIVNNLKNSFTFFKWIFIDPDYFEEPSPIVTHELGHAKKLHSIDIISLKILTVVFWWVPSLWLTIKELKNIHEYEADQFALDQSEHSYIKTLVQCTLQAHGMGLASSFDDAPIFKRLNFIKKMKKKISPWKVASVSAIVAISGALFACEDQIDTEIKKIADESTQTFEYSDDVKTALEELKVNNPNEEYTVIETRLENGESIDKLKQYDTDQIEHIFVTKTDDQKTITMIINKKAEVFDIALDVQKSNEQGVFTITETPASYPGGKDALYAYLLSEIKYPEDAIEQKLEGSVFVEFVVETDGTISEARVVKGIGQSCDAEALRVINKFPKWNPGIVDGKPVRQRMIQRIAFKQ